MVVLVFVYIILLAINCVLAGRTNCRDTWVAYHNSCYLFAHDQFLSFTEAQHFCLQHSSHLVNIEDVHEDHFLKQFLQHFKVNKWWIGLTDVLIEGEWMWVDTDSVASYLAWSPNEPDNSDIEEDCVGYSWQFKWADDQCSKKLQPICEEDVSTDLEIVG